MTPPLIEFDRVSKSFGPVRALADVSFDVLPGEFLALCGENGAGKSTLMKVLSGVITDYEGELRFEGQPVRFSSTRAAEARGISIIHQELNLVGDLSIAANIFLGRELCSGGFWLNQESMNRSSAALLQQLNCHLDVGLPVRQLRVGDQQLVEIAKALSVKARVLIMDEPTSALTERETERLFSVITQLRALGTTIVYISHKMDEIFRWADRITVLRDGQVVSTAERSRTSRELVTRQMVGRDVVVDVLPDAKPIDGTHSTRDEVLRVTELSLPWRGHARQWRLHDISFQVHAGEAVGIAGLMGAGRTELLECLYGCSPEPPQGEIRLRGQEIQPRSPQAALKLGIAMVSEDRKRDGIIPPFTVQDHILLSALPSVSRAGWILPQLEMERARLAINRLGIRTSGPDALATQLSGGNQQKCLIAKALETHPVLLLLDDPTRGIDVGAKAEIYRLIRRLCAEGLAVIITSSELPELLTVCDRILVLSEGRLTGSFARDEFSEERLMQAATATAAITAAKTEAAV